ncbi:hypothetical protein D7Y09_05730 [bacterium 1XD42-1]|nr:hypothetical protein D7Y09_05730 [bacterium 1XD42-1]
MLAFVIFYYHTTFYLIEKVNYKKIHPKLYFYIPVGVYLYGTFKKCPNRIGFTLLERSKI